ncbi:uncharacterized protein LOC103520488 [Diaphorina citri]|uniref:Uncharacterized protein LOC103520488 n=1 Tax=Diaphorina citri TaxID=121845 RepID=A0A1S3DKM6_DIACI|nr:uncharacterized protein LOC103520488 [Diaphorina citri]
MDSTLANIKATKPRAWCACVTSRPRKSYAVYRALTNSTPSVWTSGSNPIEPVLYVEVMRPVSQILRKMAPQVACPTQGKSPLLRLSNTKDTFQPTREGRFPHL